MSARRPIPLWIPLPFLLLSGGCYCLVAEVDTLTCDRTAGECRVTRAKPLGSTTQTFAVEDLTGAELGSGWKPDGTGRLSKGTRVLLLTKQESIPFMNYTTDLGRAEMKDQVAAVRRFVASPTTPRLEIRRDNRASSLLIAAIPFGFPLAVVLGLNRRLRRFVPGAESQGKQDEPPTPPIHPV